jgi:outer membrane protein OmpA-like peptidoglycan-associated protein
MSRLARLASAPALTIVLASGLVGAAWAEPAASPESQQGSCLGKAALRGDVFEEGSARLREAELPVLDLVARAMNDACAGKPIEIQGHVDATGEAGRDQQLSQARADEVKRLLVQRHVAAERLRAVGYGSTRPLGREPDLRALNTRITFVVAGD